jgi:hypothetical protein
VKEDVARLGRRNWKVAALNRKGWRKLLKRPRPTLGCSAVGEKAGDQGSRSHVWLKTIISQKSIRPIHAVAAQSSVLTR